MNNDDENLVADIGKIVDVFSRQWPFIFLITITCMLVAGVISFLWPKTFIAEAVVSAVRTGYTASLGSTIQGAPADLPVSTDLALRRLESYALIIKNPLVLEAVMNKVNESAPENNLSIEALTEIVDGELVPGSDSIVIRVKMNDPILATEITNAWAEAFVEQVNRVYSAQNETESYAATERQLTESQQAYSTAQTAYEAHLQTAKAAFLERRISEAQELVLGLSNLQASINTLAAEDAMMKLSQAYRNRRNAEEFLLRAQLMLDQVRQGGDGAATSNLAALNVLKTQVFTIVLDEKVLLSQDTEQTGINPQPPSLEFDLVPQTPSLVFDLVPQSLSSEAVETDLRSMVSVLEKHILDLDEQIKQLSSNPIGDLPMEIIAAAQTSQNAQTDLLPEDLVNQLEKEIQVYQSELEQELAIEKNLLQTRDLAWESYKNLQIKLAELKITLGIKNAAVILASPAVIPEKDVISLVKNIILAGASGLILGLLIAYTIEFWWSYKGIAPHRLIRIGRRSVSSRAA